MEQIKLDSIREEALYGLKLENDKHEENNIKRVLEIIVVSYEKVFLPHPEEDVSQVSFCVAGLRNAIVKSGPSPLFNQRYPFL